MNVECVNTTCNWKGDLEDVVYFHHTPEPYCPICNDVVERDYTYPPCYECGAMTPEEAETRCRCGGDKDHCHGCELWPN